MSENNVIQFPGQKIELLLRAVHFLLEHHGADDSILSEDDRKSLDDSRVELMDQIDSLLEM